MKEKEIEKHLAYVSGFLDCLIALNTFANDAKTYEARLISKNAEDIPAIIEDHLGQSNWVITSELVQENWKDVFKKELVPYFAGFVGEISSYTVSANDKLNNIQTSLNQEMEIRKLAYNRYLENIADAIGYFNLSVEKLLPQKFSFYKINVNTEHAGWYEAYANDYVFDIGDQILFIHFGGE